MARYLVLILLWFALACGHDRTDDGSFELLSFAQAGRADLRLNERLEFFFNQEIYPPSVTSDSFRLWSDAGPVPSGRMRVDGKRITFEPDLPNRPDLQDGGFRPATSYRVEIAGGLQAKAVQSRRWRHLVRTYEFVFRTVGAEQPDAFIADHPESPPTAFASRPDGVQLQSQNGGLVRAGSPFVIWFDHHLDPRTVVKDSFEVKNPGEIGQPVDISANLERVELRQDERGCRVFLYPHADTPVVVDEYYVIVPAKVLDFGRVPVPESRRWIEFKGLAGG
jgi:hypothetical protein